MRASISESFTTAAAGVRQEARVDSRMSVDKQRRRCNLGTSRFYSSRLSSSTSGPGLSPLSGGLHSWRDDCFDTSHSCYCHRQTQVTFNEFLTLNNKQHLTHPIFILSLQNMVLHLESPRELIHDRHSITHRVDLPFLPPPSTPSSSSSLSSHPTISRHLRIRSTRNRTQTVQNGTEEEVSRT